MRIVLAWIPPHPAWARGGRALAHWDLRPDGGTGKQQGEGQEPSKDGGGIYHPVEGQAGQVAPLAGLSSAKRADYRDG